MIELSFEVCLLAGLAGEAGIAMHVAEHSIHVYTSILLETVHLEKRAERPDRTSGISTITNNNKYPRYQTKTATVERRLNNTTAKAQ